MNCKKIVSAFLACMLMGCAPAKNYQSVAVNACYYSGYKYSEEVFAQCVDYGNYLAKQIDGGKSYISQAEYICQQEREKTDEKYSTCVKQTQETIKKQDKLAKSNAKEMERLKIAKEKELQKEQFAAAKEKEKERLEVIAKQRRIDLNVCRGYGFKAETDKLAECVMKQEQMRIAENARQEALLMQAAIADQQYSAQIAQTIALDNQADAIRDAGQQNRFRTTCNAFGGTINCY